MSITRPLLRYHGGKFRLAPWILSHFPEHKIYTESFGGGGSILLRKQRVYDEVYNDLDGEICNLFRVLRNPSQARELIRLISLTPYSREEFEVSYLVDGDPIEQARRTVTRSFMGFGANGTAGEKTGFRSGTRSSGSSAAHDWMRYPSHLDSIVERMRGVTIENRPALEVLRFYDDAKCLHYVDPPYPHSTRGDGHYRYEMNDDDHRELAATLHGLKGMVIVSGYACDLYDAELFPRWQRIVRSTYGDNARERTEVIWISPNAVTRPQLFALEAQQRGLGGGMAAYGEEVAGFNGHTLGGEEG